MKTTTEVLWLKQTLSEKKVDGQNKRISTTKMFANVCQYTELWSKYVDFQRPIKDVFAISTYKDIVLWKSLKDIFPEDKFWNKELDIDNEEIEQIEEKITDIGKKLEILATKNNDLIEDIFGSDTEKGILKKMLLVRKNTTEAVLEKAEKSLVLLLNTKIKE